MSKKTKIPLDDIIAAVPPMYQLNYFVSEGRRYTPGHPIAMLPVGTRREVLFKFWGMDTYDLHTAFRGANEGMLIDKINYAIIVHGENSVGIKANYQHEFTHKVCLGMKGLHSYVSTLFTLYRALEHLPVLPKDWQYMQFVA